MTDSELRDLVDKLYETNASLGPFIEQLDRMTSGEPTHPVDAEELLELLEEQDRRIIDLFMLVYNPKPKKFWQFWKK